MNAASHKAKNKVSKNIGHCPQKQSHMSASEYQRRYGGTIKDPKRVYKGRNNKANGQLFKTMLANACEKYAEESVAKVSKSVEPFRIIGVLSSSPLVFKCAQEKGGEADYKGLMASGQAIVFEAKTTEQDRISWDVVMEHQRKFLDGYPLSSTTAVLWSAFC